MAEVTGMTPAKISQEITKEVGVLRSNVLADLSKKADTTYVNTELSKKASTTYVNTELSKKASTTYVDSELSKKANVTQVTSDLSKKADTTYVNTELSKKADATKVSSDLSKKADTTYVDSANTALVQRLDDVENRSPVMWIHHGSSEPVLSNFSGAKVNDIIERTSDDSQWRVGIDGLVKTRENFHNLNISHRILNRGGETSGTLRISRNGNVVSLILDLPVPDGGPTPGRELLHLPGSLWNGSSLYWAPGYAGDDSSMHLSGGYLIYPGTTRKWVRRMMTWITNSTGAAVTEAELLSPPPTP